jgi:nickel import ATP-binding protein NikE
MNMLRLEGISKSYRRGGLWGTRERFEVLRDVWLALEEGVCTGLLGRSGSGKSTLGRIALGLEAPDRGELLYYGRPVRTLDKKAYREFRRNVQVVFQNSLGAVNHRWEADRIIAEPLENFHALTPRVQRRRVLELLQRVGLSSSDAKKLPHQFSGGELQRVCIARAIALNPKLIVLDEAVSNLDMLIQARVIELLQGLQRDFGTAYLLISHDIRILLKMCGRIAIMQDGRIVDQTESMVDIDQISHRAFKRLIGAVLPPTPAPAANKSGSPITTRDPVIALSA